jgi:hypothetical protein
VPAERQHIRIDPRCIRKLHEENLVARELGDGRGVVTQRKGVKAVEDQAEVRLIRALHCLESLGEVVDLRAPSQRFETDAQAMLGGTLR